MVHVLLAALVTAGSWNPVAINVRKSLVRVEGAGHTCTGFVIDSEKKLVLTAAHCLENDETKIYVDTLPAKIVAKEIVRDLLVLGVPELDKPALHLASREPATGDEVASYGFGFGLERPVFRVAHVSDATAEVPEVSGAKFLVLDATYAPGQSGGPVVDEAGAVVGIVQMGNSVLGIGVTAEVIKDKVGKFFGK